MIVRIIFLWLLTSVLQLSEARGIVQVCPDCVYSGSQTYEQVVSMFVERKGPEDGICPFGIKWILDGTVIGSKTSACCCITNIRADTKACTIQEINDCPGCPRLLGIRQSESFASFYKRVGRTLRGAPPNGCCPIGTMKWVFSRAMIQSSEDICVCATPNKLRDDSEKTSFSFSSESSE